MRPSDRVIGCEVLGICHSPEGSCFGVVGVGRFLLVYDLMEQCGLDFAKLSNEFLLKVDKYIKMIDCW